MAFRSTNISAATEFQIAAAPGQALAAGIDKIAGSVADTIDKIKKKQEEAKIKADAVEMLKSYEQNKLNSYLQGGKFQADNIPLALNLYKLGMTAEEHKAHIAKQQIESDLLVAAKQADDNLYGNPENARALLDEVVTQQNFLPLKGQKINTIKIDPNNGLATVVPTELTPDQVASLVVPNRAYAAAKQLLQSLGKPIGKDAKGNDVYASPTVTAAQVKQILEIYNESKKDANDKGVKALDNIAKPYLEAAKITGRVELEQEKAGLRENLAKYNAQQRAAYATQRFQERWSLARQQLEDAKSLADYKDILNRNLALLNVETRASIAMLSKGYLPKMQDGVPVRNEAGAIVFETNKKDGRPITLSPEEAQARVDAARRVQDRAWIDSIEKYVSGRLTFTGTVTGQLKPEAAAWTVLNSFTPEEIGGFAKRTGNYDAIYVSLTSKFFGDLASAAPLTLKADQNQTTTVQNMLTEINKEYGLKGTKKEITFDSWQKWVEQAKVPMTAIGG